ncbi:WecB/TagA/CpsF family glycosyltransferase [Planomicrobium glaciei]|nr:WecB/TagA/CpsF family glycosyltransferase [Planococcus glaciei]
MGIGAFLDFASGSIKRAPKLIRTLRMKWILGLFWNYVVCGRDI